MKHCIIKKAVWIRSFRMRNSYIIKKVLIALTFILSFVAPVWAEEVLPIQTDSDVIDVATEKDILQGYDYSDVLREKVAPGSLDSLVLFSNYDFYYDNKLY